MHFWKGRASISRHIKQSLNLFKECMEVMNAQTVFGMLEWYKGKWDHLNGVSGKREIPGKQLYLTTTTIQNNRKFTVKKPIIAFKYPWRKGRNWYFWTPSMCLHSIQASRGVKPSVFSCLLR